MCLLALALIPFAPARRGTAQAPGYTVTDLGTLGGNAGEQSRALGLDECGKVVGESQAVAGSAAPFRPFLWKDADGDGQSDPGEMQDLGTLGGQSGAAYAVNQSGAVAGASLSAGNSQHAFFRPAAGPTPQDLGTLGGPTAEAYDINASGQVVGVSEENGGIQDRAFVWQSGTMQGLTATWGTPIRAFGINDAGQIAGTANHHVSGTHAFVTVGGVALDLGTLGGSVSFATEVNDSGEVAGYSYIFSDTITQSFHAFRWKDDDGDGASDPGEMQDLGTLGGQHSYAYDLNNSGLVVGRSETSTESADTHAFIWTNANGLQDLNNVVTGTGWTFQEAHGVNDRGQIAGFGLNPDGKVHAFLLTPTNVGPSPCDPTPTPTPTPVPGTLQFSAATYSVTEENTSVTISVSRDGGSDGAVSVNYATSNGTAAAGSDYTSAGGTLNFAEGESTKTFSVTVNHDTLDEPDETVNLTLSNPGGGATLGPQGTAVLTITDNDDQPTLQFSPATYTVGEGAGSATITVTRTGGTNAVTVSYATSTGGTAAAGSDYTAIAAATLTFAEGETSKTFDVSVSDDTLDEPDETVNLTLSSPGGGATLGSQSTATLTITDNDAQPTVQFSSATYSVAENAGGAFITVTRAGGTNGGVTVNYATSNGTAAAGSDYTAASGTLTFAAGELSKTFNVFVNEDALDEPDKALNLTLSAPSGAALGTQTTAVLTITDDDATPTLSVSDVTVDEGNTGTSPATTARFVVTLTGASAQTVTVNYNTVDGSATQPGDYAPKSGTITYAPGETGAKNIDVSVVGDTGDEPNETFGVSLSSPTNATFAVTPDDTFGIGTIRDDDGTPSLNINDVSVVEGNAGTTAATFTVSLLPASGQTVTVNYAAADGTATAGSDFALTPGTLTFAPGQTTRTVTVNVNGDAAPEAHENFVVNLSGATNAELGDPQGQGTINNDDTTLSINDVSMNEGNSGGTRFVFTVSLSHVSAVPVSFNYATANDTATSGADYVGGSATLQIPAGSTSVPIVVLVIGDNGFENDEEFAVNLSSAVNAVITDAQGRARILNDEAASLFQISGGPNFSIDEGGVKATFTITRTGSTAGGVTVNYSTANGTATAGSDYTAVSNPITFAEGETSKTFDVSITNDSLDEPDETVIVSLTPGFGASPGSASSVILKIKDDDAPPTFQFAHSFYDRYESGDTDIIKITVTRDGGTNPASVSYATSNGTATAADYTPASGTLDFAANEVVKTFDINVKNDTLDEPDETVNLTLSAGSGAALGSPNTATLIIKDDDDPPTVSIGDASLTEGGVGTQILSFNVTLSGVSGKAVSVDYATADVTASAGSDFTPVPAVTLTFSPGERTKTVGVTVLGDTLDEPDETFNVGLSSPTNATISDGTGVGTIKDDDAAPTLSAGDVTVAEGNAGAVAATFNVTLSAASGRAVTVNYATADGTAAQPGDYAPASGTLTFNPGQTAQTVTVQVAGDTLDEADETFAVNLSSPTNATVNDGTGVGTIKDDDAAPTLSVGDVAVDEGNSGTANAAFVVTLSAASAQTVTVNYITAAISATDSVDYTEVSNSLTFNPGETSRTVNVAVFGDTLDESNETFSFNIGSPTNATIADGQGIGTIKDDDGAPSLSINDVTLAEGNSGTTAATFTVTLAPASGQAVSVNYATADGTAAAGSDYAAASGTLNFAAGETTKSVTVNVNGDTANEANETFFVNLSAASNATVTDGQGQGTVHNDDTPALRFSQASYPVGEGAHFVTVTVTRTGDPTDAVGVSFNTSDGTATERRDYTAVSGRLQFAAGETSKTFDVLLTEDAYTESEETINLTLSNPTGGAGLGGQAAATVNIAADDNPPPGFNPIDNSSDFVRQHYHDFLNREPDASGLAFWTGEIEQCGADAGCREVKRINVSAAFFLSIEFQQTGYLVYRTYKAAFGDATSPNVEGTVPVVRLQEFLPDTRSIGEGVVVGQPNWEQRLDANKNAYLAEFVQRQRFLTAFPASMSAAEFVDKLNNNAGGVLTQAERDNLVAALSSDPGGAGARASALRGVAENAALQQREFRRAFVLMQFYGYLRRNPDDPQDTDFRGWKFWLDKLNEFGGNYVQAEMVKAFLDSIEYRTRFAP
ncbi:MAG TPA: Calx-beta domain-containing protein [Pyrinomonadaceae bacterium]